MESIVMSTASVEDRTLLIVEDDRPFLTRLARAMEGGATRSDRRIGGGGGARCARPRRPLRSSTCGWATATASTWWPRSAKSADDSRVIILTGYGNIATAVTAVKLGAIDYLSKPADADEIHAALTRMPGEPQPPENPMSADRVRWEHIQRVYEMCDRNVSETARRLNMHRRTLQRILAKRAPR
jgi:two-component system, response regulator RegA